MKVYFRQLFDRNLLCIYKEGKNDFESKEYIRKKVVDNQICMIAGTSGSGKSVFSNTLANEIRKCGNRTVIYVTEKESDELANAFHIFSPTKSYHVTGLERQHIETNTLPVKVYHPFTFNIPYKHKLPPMTFFGYSLKDISEEGFSTIIPTESGISVDICLDVKRIMDKKDSFYDFLWELHQRVNSEFKIDEVFNPENLFVPTERAGDKRTIKSVKSAFMPFRQDFMILPDDNLNILNYVDLLNDNEHVHHLTTKYITNQKVKTFAIVEFLKGIDNALRTGLVKNQLVLVFEEMKILIPSGNLQGYQQELLKLIRTLFSRLRTKAYVIATAQSVFDINSKFRTLFSKTFLGKLNFADIGVLNKVYQFTKVDQNKLYSLKVGDFVLWESGQYEDERLSDAIHIMLPPFANAEEGEDFFHKYKAEFKEQCVNNVGLYNSLKELNKKFESKRIESLKLWIKESDEKKVKKETKKSGQVDDAKDKLKKVQSEKQDIIMKQVYTLKTENPDMSWRDIAKQINITHPSAKKYYNLYKSIIDNQTNLPRLDKDNKNPLYKLG